ncbi:hypothetical protein H6P81_021072 [Aristolochia fimbriata]|uniref:NAC domain-containing protein n=1 Tax=Aristolochia fimbriata TaxID=158543 RepID=A0AAV7E0J3_ARIFI|nr:hypothetical protein H6P81_021072 [Aristolochia fimbriata]
MYPVAAPDENNASVTDDRRAALLRRIARGSPTPEDVLDVNPFVHHAENLPEDMLFLVNSPDRRHNEAGYWVDTGRNKRLTSTLPIVEKTTLQFYEGQAPDGNITVWLMHIYKLDCTEQYPKCLCMLDTDLELLLANLARTEENTPAFSNDSEVVSVNELRPPAASESSIRNIILRDHIDLDFIGEDYLELNDLAGYASSSSSENSSELSINSEYYLDSEEPSFREIRDDGYPDSGQRKVNRLVVSAPPLSDQVLIRLPPGSDGNKDFNPKNKENQNTDPQNKGHSTLPTGSADREASRDTKKPKHVADAHEGTATAGPSNSSGGDKKGGKGLAKMGKKFFCFAPF